MDQETNCVIDNLWSTKFYQKPNKYLKTLQNMGDVTTTNGFIVYFL